MKINLTPFIVNPLVLIIGYSFGGMTGMGIAAIILLLIHLVG